MRQKSKEPTLSHTSFNHSLFKDKKCLIIGAGKSGIWCAKLLKKKLTKFITLSDKKEIKTNFSFINEKDIDKNLIKTIDFAVKSPGIEPENPVIKLLKKFSKPIFSEVEVALSFSKTKNIIMITGTNGKSTTSYLTHLIINEHFKKNNKKSILCGNIGNPISKEILKAKKDDFLVIEISSYQLEDSNYIKPKIGVILNITPDHIEHHKSMENYIKAKFKIFSFMDENSTLIINFDDPVLARIKEKGFKLLRFSTKNKNADAFFSKKTKRIITKNNWKLKTAHIPGEHNIYNQMASVLVAMVCGIDKKTIESVFSSFKGLEHRIEFVREINGVKYYNDSKATNVDSTLVCLRSLGKKKNIHLILGGVHKNSPYKPLIPLIKRYVKKIYTVGSSQDIIKKELCGTAPIIPAGTVKKAVELTSNSAVRGDIVLLSPACASLDQFKNFEERGRKFKSYVKKL
ncbi:MAG: UDP-N-acetylmuramoyl-L-alanine--D-glutamate ligase [Elusimicrobiales bacterium]